MLLVALMNITGAWAEAETETFVFVSDGILEVRVLDFAYYTSKPSETLYEDEYCVVNRKIVDLSENWFRYTYVMECKQGFKIRGTAHILLGSAQGAWNPYKNFSAKADGVAMQHWLDNDQNVMFVSVQSASKLEINGESDLYGGLWAISSLGFDMYMPQHEHVYSAEWTQTATHHHHVCTKYPSPANGVDEKSYQHVPYVCGAKSYEGEHIYSTNPADGALNYTCSVCGYVDEARKAQYLNRDYLSLTATGGDMTIGMQKTGSPNDYVIRYSADKMQWTTQTLSATTDIVTIPAGKTYYFAHGTDDVLSRISNNQDNCWSFTMTGTGTVEAGGNTMSLLDATTQKTDLSSFAFVNLFKGCYKMTKAPKLPATSINERCYMGMFEGTNITEAPELPAASVIKGSYQNMFKNCLNLETAPDLLATRVNWAGYQEMFYGCKKITEVTLGNITVIENANAFSHWLDGTAEGTTGVANMPDALVGNVSLPSNWTAHSIDGHNYVPEKDAEGNDNWVWEGVTKATLMFVCTKNANHKQEMVATGGAITNAITTQPTCTTDGVRTYTATVTVDGVKYKGTKEVVEPKFGHSYQYGVCTRCGDSPSHFDSFTINDGDPYVITRNSTADLLTYNRYYPENVWSAWLTPFDVNASYLTANGLTPAYIEGIHNYDDNEDGTIDRTVMEIVKISNGRLLAGTPLLVRAAEGYSSQLELSDVTMKANADLNNVHTETATTKYDFIGTYTGITAAAGDNIYSLNDTGAMVHRTGSILPLRWYCQIEQKPSFIGEETSPALARAIYISVIGEEDQMTGIRTLYNEADQTLERADGIFDLSGHKLSAPQHGKINIINGKKQFVR